MLNALTLKQRLAANATADPNDILSVKQTLQNLGLYKAPDWGVTDTPDHALFDGIRNFQKGAQLTVDGAMKPGGETETALKTAAELVRRHGRNGDTVLAHISPAEAELLHRITDGGSTNPDTGLPEFFIGSVLGGLANSFVDSFAGPAVGAVVGSTVSKVAAPAIGDYVARKVSKKVGGTFGDILGSTVGGYLGNGSYGDIAGGLGQSFGDAVGNVAARKVSDKVGGSFGDAIGNSLGNAVGSTVGGAASGTLTNAFSSDFKSTTTRSGGNLDAQPMIEKDDMSWARTPGINPDADRQEGRKASKIGPLGSIAQTKPQPSWSTPVQKPKLRESKTNPVLRGPGGQPITNILTGKPIRTKDIKISSPKPKAPKPQMPQISDDMRQRIKQAQNQTQAQTMELGGDAPKPQVQEAWPRPAAQNITRPNPQGVPIETASSNARTANALLKTTDFSAIKSHVMEVWNNGGEKGRAEVLNLAQQMEQRSPGQGQKFAEAMELGTNITDGPRMDEHGNWFDENGNQTLSPNQNENFQLASNQQPQPNNASESSQNQPSLKAFGDEIAKRENKGKPLNDYGSINGAPNKFKEFALGRYQMRSLGLIDTGYLDNEGRWTGKDGIKSYQDFLNNPKIQDKAFKDYLGKTETYLQSNGSTKHLGQDIDGIKAKIKVTRSGLVSAAHRQGAANVKRYLNHMQKHEWKSDASAFDQKDRDTFLSIETRLREFQNVPLP